MNGDLHARAECLIIQDHVEQITPEEREWLNRHLEVCSDCERLASETDEALRSFRAAAVPLPPSLARRTQLRVYLRLESVQRHKHGGWPFWGSCALSWALGVASAPYVWRGFEWAGHEVGVPNLIWQMGFGLWWALPALFTAGILLTERLGKGSEEMR